MEYNCSFSYYSKCPRSKPFAQLPWYGPESDCVARCDDYYYLYDAHCCIEGYICQKLGMVEYDGKCQEGCPFGYSIDNSGHFNDSNLCRPFTYIHGALLIFCMLMIILLVVVYWRVVWSTKFSYKHDGETIETHHLERGDECRARSGRSNEIKEDQQALITETDDQDQSPVEMKSCPVWNVDSAVRAGCSTTESVEDVSLPEGKFYHLFFAYSAEDEPFVVETVNKLEQIYHLKCCFATRDFRGGETIQSQVKKFMNASMKIVFVLSQDFLGSSWCRYEVQVAFQISLNEPNVLVPIMYKYCEPPDSIAHVSYIDYCRGSKDVCKEVSKTFSLSGIVPVSSVVERDKAYDVNGDRLEFQCFPETESTWEVHWYFQPFSGKQRRYMKSAGILNSLSQIRNLLEVIGSTTYVRYYGLFTCSKRPGCCFPLLLAVFTWMILGVYFSIVALQPNTNRFIINEIAEGFVAGSFLFVGIPLHLLVVLLFKQLIKYRVRKLMKQKHGALALAHNFIPVVDITAVPKVFLKGELVKEFREAHYLTEEERDREAEEKAKMFMREWVTSNYRKLCNWSELLDADEIRHITRDEKKCVCQLVETSASYKDYIGSIANPC